MFGRGKTELLSSLTSCRGVHRPTGLCTNMRTVWNMCSPCQVTHRPGVLPKGAATLLVWASARVGAGLTVAHKRISPVHKDSRPLLTPARSTKGMTFVCFGGRRGCGQTIQGLEEKHWQKEWMRWKLKSDPFYVQQPPFSQDSSGPLQRSALVFIYFMVSPHSHKVLWWLHWPESSSCLVLLSTSLQIHGRHIKFHVQKSASLIFSLLNNYLISIIGVLSQCVEGKSEQRSTALKTTYEMWLNRKWSTICFCCQMGQCFPQS